MSDVAELLPGTEERLRRLLDLLGQEGAEREFLRAALELWRLAMEADEVAAYMTGDRGYECCARVGGESLPEIFQDPAETGFASRRVPLGVLLVRAGDSEGRVPALLTLALTAGLRLCRLRHRLEQREFDARLRGVELEAFHDVGLAITSTLDLRALSEEILLRAVSLLDARRGALYLLAEDRYRLQGTIGGDARAELPPIGDPSREHDLLPGVSHVLAVPIEIEGNRKGLVVVGDKESRRGVGPFDDHDRRSLAMFANQAAIALEQARLHRDALEKERLEREIELASDIQRGILPSTLPVLPGWELVGWTSPARHVGGDYWDVVPTEGGRVALVVGDVAGKGVPAALLVSTVHSALRLLLDRPDGYDGLFTRLNRHFLDFSASNKFVTLILAELDPATGHVRYVNAGHNPALVVRTDGRVEKLGATGLPLGLMPDPRFREGRIDLARGDLLCLYSDGMTEAASPDDEELGLPRFAELVVAARNRPLPELRGRLDAAVCDFTAGAPPGDDQTVVLLRRAG